MAIEPVFKRVLAWSKRRAEPLCVILGLLIVQGFLFGDVLVSPTAWIFSAGGDGAKNYFTFAYDVQYGDAYWNDHGFNFPYGESVVYADAQPWLAWLLGTLQLSGVQAIGVLNLLLVLGVVLHGVFLNRILARFDVKGWAGVLAAIGAALMTPQVFRITGHLGLAHAWILSLAWWMALRAEERSGWKNLAMVALTVLLAYFTHPYMGLMLAMFLGGHALIANIRDRRWFRWRPLAAHVLLPTAFFFGALRVFDVHVDRPSVPNTALDNAQSIAGLVQPTQRTLFKQLTDLWNTGTEPTWEAWCYLGAATVIICALIVVVHLLRGSGVVRPTRGLDLPGSWLLASLVPLFFAFDLQSVLNELLPALKQFRSLSRFAWVFHMVLVVFVLVRLHGYIQAAKGVLRHALLGLFVLACAADGIEGFTQHKSVAEWCRGLPNGFNGERLNAPMQALVKAARAYRPVAVMPLPFGHGGAEVYNRGGDDVVNGVMYQLVYHTASSTLAGITSRTALEETRRQFALLAPLEFEKAIKGDLQMGDTVLVICAADRLDADERRLMERCHLILENEGGKLMWISTDELVACSAKDYIGWFEQVIQPFMGSSATVGLAPEHAPRLLTRCEGGVLEWPEGTTLADTVGGYFRSAAPPVVTTEVRDEVYLYDFPPGAIDTTREYELGLVFQEVDPGARNVPVIWEHNTPGQRDGVWEQLWDMRRFPMQLKDRTMCTARFTPRGGGRRNSLFFSGRAWVDLRYTISNVHLRRLDVHYWRTEQAPGGMLIIRDNVPLNPAVLNAAAAPGN